MRLDKKKHLEAEARLRTSILEGRGYSGKEADLERVRRKQRELGLKGVRQVLGKGGGGGSGEMSSS